MTVALALIALAAQQAPAPVPTPYWQQQVEYDISARLDEESGVLAGTQRIGYVNRSPDTLTTFSLHLHLNAFRPGSRWADADSVEGRRRFNDLADPDFAFNHVRNVRIGGRAVTAIYPFAPDSTIVRFELPAPLAPGQSLELEMEWDARPSTVPRRQGRRGRRFDFAQWYPKVVVYDRYGWNENPLYPAGEFYGEFATYRVTLDVAEDQVVGATGVPLCGDPGWEKANRMPGRPIDYRRDWYGGRAPAFVVRRVNGVPACGFEGAPRPEPEPGRKTILWYAEDVHHFAMSLNPDYRYESGRYDDVAVHVLYQPGDESTWGNGVAVKRTETALAWLDQVFGKFAWPQITNVHRIEGGGTEFPMMIHDGSASQGLIVHELGHNYTQGILANNEWREGWLDEGFTSFQSSWFSEAAEEGDPYPDTENFILQLDLDGYSEPTSLVSHAYRDFTSYNIAIYTRGELFFHQLRYIVGDDTMRRILRTFYERWRLRHVNEAAFRAVAEEVSGRDLSTFFGEFLHATPLYDYAVGRVERSRAGEGRWRTRVEVVRKGEGRMPVDVAVIAGTDTAVVRAAGLAASEWVEIESAERPTRVLLDPRVRSHDWNMLNNRRTLGGLGFLAGHEPRRRYFDAYVNRRVYRDAKAIGYSPAVWYNDVGGVTLGVRRRENYLGRFDLFDAMSSTGTGWGSEAGLEENDVDFHARLRNPTWLRATNLGTSIEAFRLEGRHGARLGIEHARRDHFSFGAMRRRGISLAWTGIHDAAYLDPGYYEEVGTAELALTHGIADRVGSWNLSADMSLGGGLAYAGEGLEAATGRDDFRPFYGRLTGRVTARRALGRRITLGARLFAGSTIGSGATAKQRQIYLAGADPYEQLANPFLRSRGALFIRPDVYYHAPGGAGIRGLDPRLSSEGVVSANVELERIVRMRPNGGLFNRVAIAAFGDAGHTIGDGAIPRAEAVRFVADAGVGLRADHRIGTLRFATRMDFPLWVSRGELAHDVKDGADEMGFRWTFSFQPAF
ncbi:MAG TPA: M1 family metallopeptidase [Gemmatimonadales bacterium]|nr:M1 family metallopeptidase [Gemmatimonadales bacterium]